MKKCLIIEDEPLAIALLSDYVTQCPGWELASSFTDPIEALRFLEENPVDLILLDIQMPTLTGIQFVKVIGDKYPVIFTTAYENYALEGFELEVLDYLLKPISLERFLKSMQKASQRLDQLSSPVFQISEAAGPDYLFVKTGYKTVRIAYADICYLEGLGDYVAIHTKDDKILSLDSIKSFMLRLPAERFVRVHRSYAVALEQIESIERNRIIIKDSYIPIGPKYQDDFWRRVNGN
ncbi:MAG: LytR/AlgR family response regulator transcription factor [Bacteroidia bacterium]